MTSAIYGNDQLRVSFKDIVVTVLFAGVVSLVVWEVWSKVIAPFYMGGALSPVGLVKSSFGIGKETFPALFSASSNAVGNAVANGVHVLTGLVAYPLGYMMIARPLQQRVMPSLHWSVTGFAFGVVLYVFAMGIMAGIFAGFPPFFGFNALSQASLIGHVLVGLAIAAAVEARAQSVA